THRKINMSFAVAATSKQDFDEMWLKVNKLITLVYPQWSAGTRLDTPDGQSFIQPFTQIPTASPLIRIRLGDVIRSNYSRFNLARLFGLGTDNFNVDTSINEKQLDSLAKDANDRIVAASKIQ